MRITKFQSNYALLFMLITAFLAMQLTTTHIHLAEQHNHDGSHHQHQIEAHAHNLTDQHTDAIDFSHQTGDANVVEFDHECSSAKREKQEDPSASAFEPLQASLPGSIKIPLIINTKLAHLDHSIVNPRAPPHSS